MNLGAFIRDVDDAGFLLRRCVHSPGAIAGCPGQHTYFGSKPKKADQNPKKCGRYGRFGPDVWVVLRRTEEGTGEVASCGILAHLLRADHEFVFPISVQLQRKATTTFVLWALPHRLSD